MKCFFVTYFILQPNAQNEENGETPLHTAVMARDVNVVALLVKFKGDAKINNNNFRTPLALATENGDEDIIELLSPETTRMVHQRLQTGLFDHDNDIEPDLNDDDNNDTNLG